MTINDRVKYLYSNHLKIRAIDFAKSIGMSKSVVSNLDNAANAPSFRFIEAIVKTYPEINSRWLIVGEGEMLLGQGVEPFNTAPALKAEKELINTNEASLLAQLADKERIIQLQDELIKSYKSRLSDDATPPI